MGSEREAGGSGPRDPGDEERGGSTEEAERAEQAEELRYVDSPGAALAGDETDDVPEPNEPA